MKRCRRLEKYHFTKGFFGTNGVTKKAGFTTPDANEAMVKKTAIEQCQKKYVLCDHSKFGEDSVQVTFPGIYRCRCDHGSYRRRISGLREYCGYRINE